MSVLAISGELPIGIAIGALLLYASMRVYRRLQLSRAKHGSLAGHSKMSRRVAKLLPFYGYSEERFFGVDGAPVDVVEGRREAFDALSRRLLQSSPISLGASGELESTVSDVRFTNAYRVPFQFRKLVAEKLPASLFLQRTQGPYAIDLDGNDYLDLTASYGVNVFGHEFYKDCLERAFRRAEALGPVLGRYHPVVADNVRRLLAVSKQDEVSFHMSGTEAVMQAVRLARYHTGRSHLVRFCGAYHGWWDGVQPGVGNPRRVHDVYTLEEGSNATLEVLRTRKDIACVLVNPLQALHPNKSAPSDASLVSSRAAAHYDKAKYADWLHRLRKVCTDSGIALI
ncbi:MAG: aminotransferase class III-fold pyridoxal phosphate-dependent enzyme, partial [Planctomycetes bacterium]|nr:aminotransferase class III-fold pyridoxal phosphate-dependent enzyme [Planctomycetota bacterium]